MFGIFGKIKIIMAGIVAALLPILYIIGRRDGAKVEEVKQVKASAKASEDRAEFYKESTAPQLKFIPRLLIIV